MAACSALVVPTPTAVPPTPSPIPSPTPIGYREGWILTWQDEFAGPEIDAANWTHEIGGNGWGNAEDQFYTAEPENSFIENGNLVIQALEQRKQGKPYTSARLITKDKFSQTYGRFEARLQIPKGQGIWPAFWMLGEDISTAGWPESGEIDIMENIGKEPTMIHGTVHGPGYSGARGVGASYSLPDGRPFADDFHVFAIEWEPEEIRWYVDDVLFNTVTPSDVAGDWVYDHPFFILLNLAVGGQWPGYPDATTQFPQRLTVDYVRVYERP
ncbi:MAG: glycoside hydrolase family 16 protein [Chloroflexi bacterium]|nr:glycoside hydrolase family 16 protein [Chloroflexota bacterium]MBP7044629.1 glycoside hydrolase family 16 protein [Chloroflexota bacterium]